MILVEVGLHKEFFEKVKALQPELIKQNCDCQVCHKLMKVLELIEIKENEDSYERDDSIESFVVFTKKQITESVSKERKD